MPRIILFSISREVGLQPRPIPFKVTVFQTFGVGVGAGSTPAGTTAVRSRPLMPQARVAPGAEPGVHGHPRLPESFAASITETVDVIVVVKSSAPSTYLLG